MESKTDNPQIAEGMHSEGNETKRSWATSTLRWTGRFLFVCVLLFVLLWTIGAVRYLDGWLPETFCQALAILTGVVFVVCVFLARYRRPSIIGLCCLGLALMLFYQTRQPIHDRLWTAGQDVLPTSIVSADGNRITLTDIRDFKYAKDGTADERRLTREFDLNRLNSVWFGVDRFSEVEPVAHTFISFGFLNDSPNGNDVSNTQTSNADTRKNASERAGQPTETFIAFSVETRREKDELYYSPFRGIYSHYEMIYVAATEEDMLMQRSTVLAHPVQLYPMRATKAQMKTMFLDIAKRLNRLVEQPEFYHTIRNNCTNNLVAHANHAGGPNVGEINMWQRGVIFPGYTDWLAYKYGLINTELSLEEARKRFRIDQRAGEWDGQTDFSTFLRNESND